ncbi:MAG TPA: cobalamin-binding protein [Candidatus Binatia bacterium]|nr:cobalamin-binding protein [Candidatus Binatia bacterium]
MRICSLLPAATEIAFALGLGDALVGVTHECDYPPQAKEKPVVVRTVIDVARMTSEEIDRKVGKALQTGKGLYTIDEDAFINAAPDLILTQGLCDVCALDYNEVVKATAKLSRPPTIMSLNPHCLADVLDDIRRIGAATERLSVAEKLVQGLQQRIDRVDHASPAYRPRVVCLEWYEPLYAAGHWAPEMVELAGGQDMLGRKGEPSSKVEWRDVVAARPEVILLMPCGFDVRRTVKEATLLRRREGWNDLPAVRAGKVFAVNGNAYFSRPGPRLIDGLEILAQLICPEKIARSLSTADAARFN